MLYSADCPWASILEFNTSLPKKGGSIHLTSTYSSLLLKWFIKVCWSPPFRIFSALEDPHDTHLQKKTMPRGSTTTTGVLPLFFCPFSSRRWVSSLLRWMKKWWNFQEATIFVEENQQKLRGLESKLLMVCRWYSSSKPNVAGIILGFVGSMLLRIKNLVAASFITPYSDRTMRERSHGIWAKFGHQPAKTWNGRSPLQQQKKCREISGTIGPHLEGGTATSVTLELVGNRRPLEKRYSKIHPSRTPGIRHHVHSFSGCFLVMAKGTITAMPWPKNKPRCFQEIRPE